MSDWSAIPTPLPTGRGLHHAVLRDGRPATRAEVLAGWRGDAAFRGWFTHLLAGAPYSAFRWETPVLTTATLSHPYEHVLLDAPGLTRAPDVAAFADAVRRTPSAPFVRFTNLGGDATLVVPSPRGPPAAYVHLAGFLRDAPEDQRAELWRAVGEAVAIRLGDRPLWLSTAGAGVAWLHVRLDDRPKYYGHAAYRAG